MFKTLKLYCIVLYCIVLCAFVGECGSWTEYDDGLYLKTNSDGVVGVGPKLTVAWDISDEGWGCRQLWIKDIQIWRTDHPKLCKSVYERK